MNNVIVYRACRDCGDYYAPGDLFVHWEGDPATGPSRCLCARCSAAVAQAAPPASGAPLPACQDVARGAQAHQTSEATPKRGGNPRGSEIWIAGGLSLVLLLCSSEVWLVAAVMGFVAVAGIVLLWREGKGRGGHA